MSVTLQLWAIMRQEQCRSYDGQLLIQLKLQIQYRLYMVDHHGQHLGCSNSTNRMADNHG